MFFFQKSKLIIYLVCAAFFYSKTFASKIQSTDKKYLFIQTKGTAYSFKNSNSPIYLEEHKVKYLGEKLIEAQTDYFKVDKDNNKLKKIAAMSSDFTDSIKLPTYIFNDLVYDFYDGVRKKNNSYQMFYKNENENENEKEIKDHLDKFAGQGWHYYILDKLEKGSYSFKNKLLKLLIPGRLDYFTFKFTEERREGRYLSLKLEHSNFFLRNFLPNIELKYNKEEKSLIQYIGPSNILDKDGNTQKVLIKYK